MSPDEPARFCAFCETKLERKVRGNYLESPKHFLTRKYCNMKCSSNVRKGVQAPPPKKKDPKVMVDAKLLNTIQTARGQIFYVRVLLPVSILLGSLPYFHVDHVEGCTAAPHYPEFKKSENPKGMHALMKTAYDDAVEYKRDLESQGVSEFDASHVLPLGTVVAAYGLIKESDIDAMQSNMGRHMQLTDFLDALKNPHR